MKKKQLVKQFICYAGLTALTSLRIMGANPFLPGVVGIMGAETLQKPILLFCLMLGLGLFVPYITAAKYLAIGIAVLVGESLIKRRHGAVNTPACALLVGGCVFFIGIAGEVGELSRYGFYAVALEAAFGTGMVLCFKEVFHIFLVEKGRLYVAVQKAVLPMGKSIGGYIQAVEKLADCLVPAAAGGNALQAEKNQVVKSGLTAIAGVLRDCVKEKEYLCPDKASQIQRLEYLLQEKGIASRQYSYLEDEEGRGILLFYARAQTKRRVSKKVVARLAEQTFGMPFLPEEKEPLYLTDTEQEILLRERGRFTVRFFTAGQSKEEGCLCGDNFSVLRKNDGKTVLMLSDGMGCGQTACRQSERVLELIEELLTAGFPVKDALNMSNGCLAGQCEDGFLATVDLCEIDEFSGEAYFYKMGAPAGFLIRKNQVEIVRAEELPAGALVKPTGNPVKKKLYDGDYLVMVSDGVLDGLMAQEPEEAMKNLLMMLPKKNPGAMAEEIMKVLKETQGDRKDDCMILVAGISER